MPADHHRVPRCCIHSAGKMGRLLHPRLRDIHRRLSSRERKHSEHLQPFQYQRLLGKSSNVFQSTTSFSFTPTTPKDDFSGPGTYEYYCQFHPTSMHGKFTVYKSVDLDNNGVVNIVDVATVAFSFDATPTSSTWNLAADIDNNGVVNIIDVAIAAFYFGDTI